MGRVKLYFKQAPTVSMVVDATWQQEVSMSVPLIISPAESEGRMNQIELGDSGTGFAPGLQPGSTVDLVVEMTGCDAPSTSCGKFKILSVASC